MKLYYAVRPIVIFAFKLYFKKIYYSGSEKIPKGKPLIFSCNHPTGFFEPCLLACVTPDVEYNFITRGDMFQNPLHRRLMESLNMIPIFRFRDGFSKMKDNASSMEFIYQALAENRSILIFSEGGTVTEKRLRPIQKGLARMAFGNFEQFGDLDLHIVPVCFSYSDPHRFRSEAMLQFGDPIPLSNYYNLYTEGPPKATSKVTADVENAMKKLLIHVENPANDELVEKLLSLYRNTYPEPVFPIYKHSKRRLLAQQEIAENVNQLTDNQLVTIDEKINNYFNHLKDKTVEDIAIAQPWHETNKSLLLLIFGFLPFFVGWLVHQFPVWYALKVRRERVKYLEFKGPVTAGVGLGVSLFLYLFLFIFALIFSKFVLAAFVLFLPLLGFYALIYRDLWVKYRACSRLKSLNTEGVVSLQKEREEILKMVRG